jgi:hypothetical protein
MNSTRGPASRGTDRSFGLSVGTVLCLLAAALFWRRRLPASAIMAAIGATLVLLGAVRPSLLKWPHVWWWRVARVIGDFNARVLLTVMFVVVFVPVGFIWRLTRKDPLARRRSASPGWSPYPDRYRDRRHYLRMY